MATTVRDVMTRRVLAAHEDAGFKDIVMILRRGRFSSLPVIDQLGVVIGVVSEGDLLAKMAVEPVLPVAASPQRRGAKAAALAAGELMTRPAITIGPSATLRDAAQLMQDQRVKRLPVVDDSGRLMGIVSRVDLLGVFGRRDEEIRAEIAQRILAGDFALDPRGFDVSVAAGIVTIRGDVAARDTIALLLDAISDVEGVISVRDRLRHSGPVVPDGAQQSPAPA
jgi:CBS domain-containing protein